METQSELLAANGNAANDENKPEIPAELLTAFDGLSTPAKVERQLSPIQQAKVNFRTEVRSLSKAFMVLRIEHKEVRKIVQAGLSQGKKYNLDLARDIIAAGKLKLLIDSFTAAERKRELWSADQLINPFLRAITVKKGK